MTHAMRAAAAALMIAALAGPAAADEVEDALTAGLEAYRAGDLSSAKEEVDYAAQLLAQQKAAGLSGFLPAPLPGWERVEEENKGQSAAMFGGGMMAGATYAKEGAQVKIEMLADNQMVTAMGAMLGNPALMGSMGTVKRIKRQNVVITPDGEIQAMVANRVLIKVSGKAEMDDKEAYFAAIDLAGLKDF